MMDWCKEARKSCEIRGYAVDISNISHCYPALCADGKQHFLPESIINQWVLEDFKG